MWASASARAAARSAPSSSAMAWPVRGGHVDELAIPVRLGDHVAPVPWPAGVLDEPVPAVQLGDLGQQPAADLGVQRRLDPSIGLRLPPVNAVHRERKRHRQRMARLAGHPAHQGVEDRLVVVRVHAPGRLGREPREHAVGRLDVAGREVALEGPPERARPGQVPAGQHGLDVHARATDQDRQGLPGRGERRKLVPRQLGVRLQRQLRRRVGHVEQAVLEPAHLRGLDLARADVHTGVDLPGIGVQHDRAQAAPGRGLADVERQRGLAGRRRPVDGDGGPARRAGGSHGWPRGGRQ